MNEQSQLVCPQCGAQRKQATVPCWLCFTDAGQPEIVDAIAVPDHEHSPLAKSPAFGVIDRLCMVACLGLGVMIVLITVGTFVDTPGIAIAFLVLTTPALIVTIVRAQRLRRTRGYVTWADRLLTFILSALAIYGVLVGISIAALIALVAFCFATIATGR